MIEKSLLDLLRSHIQLLKLLFLASLSFLLWTGNLEAGEVQAKKFISSINNVDLMKRAQLDAQGQLIGQEYFVVNHNPYPVYIKIYLTKETNVRNELTTMTKTVLPSQQMSLGHVSKDKQGNAVWDYDWVVSRSPL